MPGALVTFEGIDQAGKQTQALAVQERLRARGVSCALRYYPDYDTPIGKLIQNALVQGTPLAARARTMLFAANRWECDAHMRSRYGKGLEAIFTADKYQLMHIEMFSQGIIHAECAGGDIDLLLNQRATIGCFPWRLVDGESCISRIVAFVDDDRHAALMETAVQPSASRSRAGPMTSMVRPSNITTTPLCAPAGTFSLPTRTRRNSSITRQGPRSAVRSSGTKTLLLHQLRVHE